MAMGHGARRRPVVRADVLGADLTSITEVARLAGVSIATASRVVSEADYPVSAPDARAGARRPRASSTTCPTLSRAGCSRARSRSSGVIVHDITDPYFAEVVRGVEDAAESGGYLVITCSSERDGAREASYVRLLRSMRAAGVIFAGSGLDDPGVGRGAAAPRGRAARVRRRGRPPLAPRAGRAGDQRRQPGRDRVDGRGARRDWATAESRSWPGRRRCTWRASAWPATGADSGTAGIDVDERLIIDTRLLRRGGRACRRRPARRRRPSRAPTSPRSCAPTTCSRWALCSACTSTASAFPATCRSPASTTFRSRR